MFNIKDQALRLFDYLNQQHYNIKNTIEEEVDKKLPFVDVLIDNNGPLKTSVYHKSTFTGLYTCFESFIPFKYELGLIRTLVDRTYKISNNWFSFDVGIKELIKTLGRNAYPPYLINNTVKRYLHQKYSQNENKVEDKNARQTH